MPGFSIQKNQPKGNIIVFALSAIAIMSVTAALLTTATILEIRKSANIERAALARYKAESGIENSLFLLSKGLQAGHDFDTVKGFFGFTLAELDDFAKKIPCTGYPNSLLDADCESVIVQFGVEELHFSPNLEDVITINVFDPGDQNSPPYSVYDINRLELSWPDTDPNDYEFEVTFVPWDTSGVDIVTLDPMKRIVSDSSEYDVNDSPFPNNNVASLPFPCDIPEGEDLCNGMGTVSNVYGKIRIRLLSPSPASRITLTFFKDAQHICDPITQDASQCIPGFFVITSVGKDVFNKQAIKVITSLPNQEQQTSNIWDYVIFSDKSLSK